jgi:hypothetical protein
MRTLHFIFVVFVTLASVGLLFARSAFIPLPDRCKKADFIGVIEIVSTNSAGASAPFIQVARARVIETIKGHAATNTLDLDFNRDREDTVIYSPGERILVFLTKQPSELFTTTYDSFSCKFRVALKAVEYYRGTNDMVLNWKVDVDYKSLDEVRKEIHKYAD